MFFLILMYSFLQTKKLPLLLLAQLLISAVAIADDPVASDKYVSEQHWHYNLSLVYSKRTLDGTIVNRTPIDSNTFGNLLATGESMNVGTSDEFMLAVSAYYKKWGVGLNYMPTSFSGTGSSLVEVDSGSTGVIVETQLNTNIDVNMVLANLTYDFIKTGNNIFGVGVGLGSTSIDLSIIPDVGDSIIYNGNQPFGFLNIHMSSKHNNFSYGFSMNGISADFDDAAVDYSQYTVNLGYRVKDGAVKLDIIGGYRQVNFAIDLQGEQNIVRADVVLEGPYLGVNLVY